MCVRIAVRQVGFAKLMEQRILILVNNVSLFDFCHDIIGSVLVCWGPKFKHWPNTIDFVFAWLAEG